ncbi:MAG TPA: type I methionyl aminopeptidase [Chloroflexia bacterium]
MSIETEKDLTALRRIGEIVGLTLQHMQAQVQPGMTTRDLDAIGGAFLKKYGARPAPLLVYKFPGIACISLNEEAAHGIPSDRTIREGDLVKLDLSAELNGYFTDAAVTVPVPPLPTRKQQLCDCARATLDAALNAARAGAPINRIGAAAETTARRYGFQVVRDLCGHGVGRGLHEAPSVPNYFVPRARQRLTEGLVLAVEPHVAAGRDAVVTDANGWTIKTRDCSVVANFEHTIVVTRDRPLLVTAV